MILNKFFILLILYIYLNFLIIFLFIAKKIKSYQKFIQIGLNTNKVSHLKNLNLSSDKIFYVVNKIMNFYKLNSCFIRSIAFYKVCKLLGFCPTLHISVSKKNNFASHAHISINNIHYDSPDMDFKIIAEY